MRSPNGYAVWTFADAPVVERDTARCGHCGSQIFIKPGTASTVYLFPQLTGPDKEEPGAGCRVCMSRTICLPCHDKGVCVPLERKIEQMEARGRLRRRMRSVI